MPAAVAARVSQQLVTPGHTLALHARAARRVLAAVPRRRLSRRRRDGAIDAVEGKVPVRVGEGLEAVRGRGIRARRTERVHRRGSPVFASQRGVRGGDTGGFGRRRRRAHGARRGAVGAARHLGVRAG